MIYFIPHICHLKIKSGGTGRNLYPLRGFNPWPLTPGRSLELLKERNAKSNETGGHKKGQQGIAGDQGKSLTHQRSQSGRGLQNSVQTGFGDFSRYDSSFPQ